MKIIVTAKPNAPEERVVQKEEGHFIVSVPEPPHQGKANKAIIRALANYFHVPIWNVTIKAGHTAREKIVEITS
ncbi:MAG: DUF167 domain-containing protein [Candidatus Sungbacteria bacterium]|nr:DUF167 domain-containing protein [Candidatus Sungbacteria bacterium]